MPLPYTETPEDYLTRHGSVMAPEPTGFERIRNLLFGSNPAEWAANYGTLGMGATQLVRPTVPTGGPGAAAVPQAVRSMGREAMQYLRAAGKRVGLQPTRAPGPRGRFLSDQTGQGISTVQLAPGASPSTAYHELAGHWLNSELPAYAKEPVAQAMQTVGEIEKSAASARAFQPPRLYKQPTAYSQLSEMYPEQLVPKEMMAWSREPGAAGGRATQLQPESQDLFNLAFREARKRLAEIMRRQIE